jgi:hypothetical protein
MAKDREQWRALANTGSIKYWEILEWLSSMELGF